MPFDGSGNYTTPSAPTFPAVTGTTISATYYNSVINDLAAAMNNVLTKDGQGKPSAAIDWNGKNLTGVAAFTITGLATLGGNATVAGTLGVTGATTLSSTLAVTGAVTLTVPLAVASGGLGISTVPANGKIPIGNGTNYTAANITSSGGTITITNGAGTIDLALTTITALNTNVTLSETGTISASTLGFRGVPQNAQAGYTLALTDQGKHVFLTGNPVIPANGSVAFPVGTVIWLVNNGTTTRTISITTDTLTWSGTTSTGSRTLAANGIATILKVASTSWLIMGNVT